MPIPLRDFLNRAAEPAATPAADSALGPFDCALLREAKQHFAQDDSVGTWFVANCLYKGYS
jgi:hypothetical protein